MKRNVKKTYRAIVWDCNDGAETKWSDRIRGLRMFKNKRYYEIMEKSNK